jgi:hypothetical protein
MASRNVLTAGSALSPCDRTCENSRATSDPAVGDARADRCPIHRGSRDQGQ